MSVADAGPEGAVEEEFATEQPEEIANLLGQVRQIRKDNAEKQHFVDLDIPGYNRLLVGRFRPYAIAKSERKAEAFRKRQQTGQPILLDVACDTLIDSCEQIMVRKPGATDPIPIDNEFPIKFDMRLAELLQLGETVKTARQIVKAVFPTEQSITQTSIEVNEYLTSLRKESDEETLGN